MQTLINLAERIAGQIAESGVVGGLLVLSLIGNLVLLYVWRADVKESLLEELRQQSDADEKERKALATALKTVRDELAQIRSDQAEARSDMRTFAETNGRVMGELARSLGDVRSRAS